MFWDQKPMISWHDKGEMQETIDRRAQTGTVSYHILMILYLVRLSSWPWPLTDTDTGPDGPWAWSGLAIHSNRTFSFFCSFKHCNWPYFPDYLLLISDPFHFAFCATASERSLDSSSTDQVGETACERSRSQTESDGSISSFKTALQRTKPGV